MSFSIVLMIIKNLLTTHKNKTSSVNIINCPGEKRKERTKEINNLFNIKNGEELTQVNSKGDILFFVCIFEKFRKVLNKEFGNNSLY